MIAWVSPDRTVRSTPRRISLTSSPSPTVTCRSRISRTDMLLLSCWPRRGASRRWRHRRTRPPLPRGPGRRTPARWPAGWWARRCAGRSTTRAASTRWSGRRGTPRRPPRTAAPRRGSRGPRSRRPRPRTGRRRCRRQPVAPAASQARGCPSARRPARTSRGDLLLGQVRARESLSAEAGLDGGHQPVLQAVDADELDDVGEEAAHHEAAGGLGVDAARAEVEQLLVVEPAGRAGVTGADDLAGLDLQVRHGVGAGAVGEHQVAVELVGLRARGRRTNADVADPDRARLLALQRALVLDVAAAVRDGVVDPEPVLLVLGLVGEVDAEELRGAAGAGVLHVADQPHQVAPEGDHDLLEARVAADDGVVLAAVHRAGRPVLHGHERDLRAVTDEHGDAAGVPREAGVVEDDGRLRERTDLDDELAPHDVVRTGAGEAERDRSVE